MFSSSSENQEEEVKSESSDSDIIFDTQMIYDDDEFDFDEESNEVYSLGSDYSISSFSLSESSYNPESS